MASQQIIELPRLDARIILPFARLSYSQGEIIKAKRDMGVSWDQISTEIQIDLDDLRPSYATYLRKLEARRMFDDVLKERTAPVMMLKPGEYIDRHIVLRAIEHYLLEWNYSVKMPGHVLRWTTDHEYNFICAQRIYLDGAW